MFVKRSAETLILDISLMPFSDIDSQITQTLMDLIDNPEKNFIIQGNAMTAVHAQKIQDFVKAHQQLTLNINLPPHLENTRIQIELDNLISNNRFEKNSQKIRNQLPVAQAILHRPKGRVIPKGKIIPRIEITLHEISKEEIPQPVANVESLSVVRIANDELPRLSRIPLAERVITEILAHPTQDANRSKWKDLTDRNEAQKFRKDISTLFNEESHPLPELIKNTIELSHSFTKWSAKLTFGEEQYDALLDVYGQYGEPGLTHLFRTWDEYVNDAYKGPAFIDCYASLLKHMPTFLPFIEDKEFQDTVSKVANLSKEHRSWWIALIQNHGDKKGYSSFAALFKEFTDTVNDIEQRGLTFREIRTITYANDLPSTLNGFLELLTKCPTKDQALQWDCINDIIVPTPNPFHFIIPEMQVAGDLEEKGDLEWIRTLLNQNKNSNPELVIPAFYRYLATQEQHLPIEQYRKIINELVAKQDLDNEGKIRMLYILAKSTSTKAKTGFDPKAVLEEWESFQTRMIKLDSLERLKANRSGIGKTLFTRAIDAQGGYPAVRIQTLKPIMDMAVTPPMSYLNKLLKLSEYKFLDPQLSILELQSAQSDMMKKMDKAALLYKEYPESMMHAIRLIKTETVKVNNEGQYFPAPQDITLLEQFISACETLTDSDINSFMPPELNPNHVLLPLLSTFHIEYESKAEFINEVIEPYKKRITAANPNHAQYQEKIHALLPYGLSLLQLVQNREQPNKLDHNVLNQIQDDLMHLICRVEPTTKKEIREWMHREFGRHFSGNVLLDIKDTFNFGSLFKDLNFTQKESYLPIEQLVSNFDNDEEKDQHKALVKSLVNLTNTLTPNQKERFFEFCKDAFKTNELLSRNKNPGPPTYLSQFKCFVDSITTSRAFEEFEQYMSLAQEFRSNNDITNSLSKFTYLLNVLYPLLMKEGVTRKEAFNFSAELVCLISLGALHSHHTNAKVSTPADSPKELSELGELIFDFIYYEDSATKSLTKLRNIQKNIDAIVTLSKDNPDHFKDLRAISIHIAEVIRTVENRIAQQNNQTFIRNVFSYVVNAFSKSLDVTREEINRLVGKGLSAELVDEDSKTHKDFLAIKKKENQLYQNIVLHLHTKKTELIKKYSNIATRANDFISKALKVSPQDVSKNHNDVCLLIDKFISLNDQNLVLSLMYHFSGGLPDRNVQDLIDLFNSPAFTELSSNLQKNFINAVISQMNNSVQCSKADVHSFLKFIHTNKENVSITQYLYDYYQHAPYPSLSTFSGWISTARFNPEIAKRDIEEKYQYFSKHPCAQDNHNGREKENGFKLPVAKQIIEKMPEVKNIFTSAYLNKINYEQQRAKGLSTKQLLDQLKKLKDKPLDNHIIMVTLAAELLHRCKGRTPEFVGNEQILGRSYELNTTQIIAILSLLETGNKVTAEIGTGEGKSRIMMILTACQFLKGNTVDFLTSNLALAERDYLEALPFFNSLGAEVNFITSSSHIEDYKIGGINFSDPENLCLFRNKGFSQNKADQVLNKDSKKRALLLDEADVTYFDVANLKYNYSSTVPKINIDLLPLFPLLMDFFAQSDTEKTYLENKQRCNEQLLSFIESRNIELFKILKSLPASQLEKWQDSAYSARHLEYNIDYTVVADAVISTPLGNKKAAAAMCHIGPRISKNSNFADGIHQCLHAELNRLMKLQNPSIADRHLKEALELCKSKKRVFTISPMRMINFSSSSNTLLKAYSQGSLHAVTGTMGSEMEQKEAQSEFGTQFISIPRHNGIRRFDRPTRILTNQEAQLDALIDHILDSREKKQPILLFCKNDNESKILQDKLEERLRTKRNKEGLPKLTRIHAGIEFDGTISEAEYIKNEAGKPGQVTITTEMEGRGVDIDLKGEGHNAGLKVLVTFLPCGERDYGQIIGRSGRYGAIGETQMVLNLESLKEEFGINQLNTDFYLNSEDFINKLQIFASHTKELRRLFHRTYDNYLSNFADRSTTLQKEEHLLAPAWGGFLEQYNHSKEITLQVIEAQLEQKNPNIAIINEQLKQHNLKAQELWNVFVQQLPESLKEIEQRNKPIDNLKPPTLLKQWLKELQQMKQDSVVIDDVQKVRVQEQFDITTAGRVQIVKNPSVFTGFVADVHAAWRNEGILFPNLRAWWAGQLSLTNFLSQLPVFCWVISPKDETRIIKKLVPASYAVLLKKLADEERNPAQQNNQGAEREDFLYIEPLFQPQGMKPHEEVPAPNPPAPGS